MKKQMSSGASKVLVILIVLAIMAVAAIGGLWATRFKKQTATVAQAPVAKHMKITQMPPEISPPQPSTEPAQLQQEASGSPESGIDVSGEQPLQESVESQPVEPSEPQVTEASASNTEAAGEKALNEQSEPTADDPAHDEVSEVQQGEDTAADVVESAPPEPAEALPEVKTDADTLQFNLQVGAFRNKAYAIEAVRKLSKSGYDPFIFEITDSRQRIWHTVRIGRYKTYEEAASALERFKQKEDVEAIITSSSRP